ncbi:MAG: ribonuclease HIII [Erysipelotrichaceae bacterium]|jgi:ribonuclease HIII|nr:ribonuclease HIII [Erysipelotrichaceae bacterium]
MATFSVKLSDEKIAQLKKTFNEYIKKSPNEYIDTFIQKEDLTISIYTSNKVVFQGNDAFFYAQAYLETKSGRQAGSDEVGTGDAFGPVIVCAAIVEENDYDYITEKHITDSKQLDDKYIRQLGPDLMNRFKHSLLILDNATYNRVHENNNLNAIKAKMHNKAFLNMKAKGYDIPKAAYIDQFCAVNDYFRYLFDEKEIYRDLVFETKAESKYPAVAIGSMISRYAFLEYMDKLEQKYAIRFHKGSSDLEGIKADTELFISRFGKNRLNEVAKLHFKNFDPYR